MNTQVASSEEAMRTVEVMDAGEPRPDTSRMAFETALDELPLDVDGSSVRRRRWCQRRRS